MKKISVNLLVFFAKVIIFTKRLLTVFFVGLVYRPGRAVLRWIFYKIVVRIYRTYLSALKKIGWSGFRENVPAFILDQKLAHVIVVGLTAVFIFYNLTASSRAQSIDSSGGKTILEGLVQSEFGTQEEQQLIEEFFDQEAVISPTQQKYLDSLGAVREQPVPELNPDEGSGLAQNETPGAVKEDFSGIGKTKILRREVVNYSVEDGDTVSTIAEKFGISVNSILWANNLSAYSLIRPGDSLVILPVSGVIHQVAKGETLKAISNKYGIDEALIREFNELKGDQLAISQKIVIPGGRKESFNAPRSEARSGIALLKDLFKIKDSGRSERKTLSGNKMAWPTVGYRITQYFTWRHFAIDIANKIGTPIYASDAGEVESAGWGRGYGNQVLVDHGGGKKTRYAHMSKILVRPGQDVDKGELIGLMGSTGWSTGPHVHFEVIINGAKRNPLNYVR